MNINRILLLLNLYQIYPETEEVGGGAVHPSRTRDTREPQYGCKSRVFVRVGSGMNRGAAFT